MTSILATDALAGKRILVTGASSGIGRATAQLIAALGANVLMSARSVERLDESRDALAGSGHSVHPFDLTDSDGMVEMIREVVQATGPLDGMFHSAAIGMVRPMKLSRRTHVEDVLSAGLHGAFALARAASMRGVMGERGGSLVFMSSVAAYRGQVGMSSYSASKGAIDAAVRGWACEMAPRGIRVNSIVAGAVRTEMHERTVATLPAESVADYEGKHLLGFGEPSDIASAAAFLLSDASRWVTGANWQVDGGYLAK